MNDPRTPQDYKTPRWYCIHTKPKSEHKALAHVEMLYQELQFFNPRLRYQKNTVKGKKWFIESLFPGYIFGKFSIEESLRAINHTPSVIRVLNFGGFFPSISHSIIELLQDQVDENATLTVTEAIEPGDEVEVVEGPLSGLCTVITSVIPAKDRVNILMELLGQQQQIEVHMDAIRKMGGDVRSEVASQAHGA